jgi:hypothetical protein
MPVVPAALLEEMAAEFHHKHLKALAALMVAEAAAREPGTIMILMFRKLRLAGRVQ